jgi:hypothetical protein
MTINNFSFTPATWTNKDDIPHGIGATNNAFPKSKALDTDDSYSFTFTAPGTYQYFCYHAPTWSAPSSSKRQPTATPRNDAAIGDSNRTDAILWDRLSTIASQ